MFIGREKELASLNSLYEKSGFQMAVIYGRRRVGKTELIREFTKDKPCIFYTAIETDLAGNLKSFSESIFSFFASGDTYPVFQSFEELLIFIERQVKDTRLVIVIDEYPYLAKSDHSISSILQKTIDLCFKDSNLFLILCGSSISFMEEDVLGSKSPLFGRRTSQLDIKPFDYKASAHFVPDYSPENKAIIYGITGGIAKYLSLIDINLSEVDNIIRLYFSEDGYLYEEPMNLLRQEFRNIALYNSIIEAVATGKARMNEIADATGFSTSQLSQALDRLIGVRILKKDIPLLNEKNKRYSQYIVEDGMFRFWYRFVAKSISAVSRGYGKQYFESRVRPYLHDYMGPVFEEISRDYIFDLSMNGMINTNITEIGHWRGHDDSLKEAADIDVVGIDRTDKTAVIGECKFRNHPPDRSDMEKLIHRGKLLKGYTINEMLFFSLTDVGQEVRADYEKQGLCFVSLSEIYKGL